MVPVQRWGDLKEDGTLADAVQSLRAGGGTTITPALELATQMFQDAGEMRTNKPQGYR